MKDKVKIFYCFFVLFTIFFCLYVAIFIISNNQLTVNAKSSLNTSSGEIVCNGLDFSLSKPNQITTYSIGSGRAVYFPSSTVNDYDENKVFIKQDEKEYTSILFLENVNIYANNETTYQETTFYTGISVEGSFQIVIKDDNNIFLNESKNSVGIFALNSNISIINYYEILESKSPHPVKFLLNEDELPDYDNATNDDEQETTQSYLNIYFENQILNNNDICGIAVLGDIDLKLQEDLEEDNSDSQQQEGPKFEDRGNLNVESGTVNIDLNLSQNSACIYSHNNIKITGDYLNLCGGKYSVFSRYKHILINGGELSITDFLQYGLATSQGNITFNKSKTFIKNISNYFFDSMRCIYCPSNIEEDEIYSVVFNKGEVDMDIVAQDNLVGIFCEEILFKEGTITIDVQNESQNVSIFSSLPEFVTVGAEIKASITGSQEELVDINLDNFNQLRFFSFDRIETAGNTMDNVTLIVMLASFAIFTVFLLTIYFVQKKLKIKDKK